jgi:hypothetical protein
MASFAGLLVVAGTLSQSLRLKKSGNQFLQMKKQ